MTARLLAAAAVVLMQACASTPPPPEPTPQDPALPAAPAPALTPAPPQAVITPAVPSPVAPPAGSGVLDTAKLPPFEGERQEIAEPLRGVRRVDRTARADDLWHRVRQGFAMPDLESDLVRKQIPGIDVVGRVPLDPVAWTQSAFGHELCVCISHAGCPHPGPRNDTGPPGSHLDRAGPTRSPHHQRALRTRPP